MVLAIVTEKLEDATVVLDKDQIRDIFRVIFDDPNLAEPYLDDGLAIAQFINKHPLVAEALAMGHIDPITLDVWTCKARLMARGKEFISDSIVERNIIYKEMEKLMAGAVERAQGAAAVKPVFYGAAHQVTRLLGVGLTDAIDYYSSIEKIPDFFLQSAIYETCAGLPDNYEVLPNADDRTLLRDINAGLYHDVNMPILRRTLRDAGKLSDPVNGGPVLMHPALNDLPEALRFDLRMVIAEQSYVEQELMSRSVSDAGFARLTAAEKALNCNIYASLSRLANFNTDNAQFQILDRVKDLLNALHNQNLIPREEADFRNYWYRVAIGSAYVMSMHARYRGQPERAIKDLTAHFKSLVQEGEVASNIGSVPPWVVNQLRIQTKASTQPSTEEVSRWTEAVARYLDTDIRPEFLNCIEEGPSFTIEAKPLETDAVNVRQRVSRLYEDEGYDDVTNSPTANGLNGLALAFELSATGRGALDQDIQLANDGGLSVDACNSIKDRHKRLTYSLGDAAFRLNADQPELVPVDWLANRSFVAFERSIPLRQKLPGFAPFLIRHLNATPLQPSSLTRTDIRSYVHNSLESWRSYKQKTAALSTLNSVSDHSLDLLGISSSAAQLKALQDDVAPALELKLKDSSSLDSEAIKAYRKARSTKERIRRIDRTEQQLDTLWQEIKGGPIIQSNGRSPQSTQTPQSYIQLEVRYPKHDRVALRLGNTQLQNFQGQNDLAMGVQYTLAQTGAFPDGQTRYTANLVYRMPLPTGSVVAEAILPQDMPEENKAAAMAAAADFDVPSMLTVPLGVSVQGLIKNPKTGQLQDGPSVPTNNTNTNQSVFQQALDSFGVPGLVSATNYKAAFDNGLNTVSLFFTPVVLGQSLDEIELTLSNEGTQQDPAELIEAAFVKSASNRLNAVVQKGVKALGPLRYPSNPDDYASANLRFGPTDASSPANFNLDWRGGYIAGTTAYDLKIGSVNAQATLDIIVDRDGLSVQGVRFEGSGIDFSTALVDHIATVSPSLGIQNAVQTFESNGGDITVFPEVRGKQVWLGIQATLELQDGCRTGMQTSIPFASGDLGAGFKSLLDQIVAAGAEAAICGVEKELTSTLRQYLENSSFTLFGTTVSFQLGGDGNMDIDTAQIKLEEGHLPILVTLTDAICDTAASSIGGLALRYDAGTHKIRLDFDGMTEQQGQVLGSFVECRIKAALPEELLGDRVSVDNLIVRGSHVSADIAIRSIPLIGDVVLPQQNLTDFEVDPKDIIETAAATAIENYLTQQFENETIDLADIGSLEIQEGRVDRSTVWKVGFKGELTIEDIAVDVEVLIPIKGKITDIDIRVANGGFEDALQRSAGALLAGLMPFTGDTVKIINPFFGPIDSNRRKWGYSFGIKASFPLEPNQVDFKIKRIVISSDGVTMDDEVRFGLKLPLYFGPVALSKIMITMRTGFDGRRPGIKIGADITAVEPEFSNVAKLRSELDLVDIDKPKLTMTSDLIVLNKISLMAAEGVLDLSQQTATFDAKTAGFLRDILRYDLEGELNGKTGLIYAKSELDVLGVRLDESELSICSKDCGSRNGTPGMATYRQRRQGWKIGEASVEASTDLSFKDPQIGSSVDLNLFGWRPPARARIVGDIYRTEANMDFLGMDVTVITPNFASMSPELLMDVLKSLLDIDLKNLLDVDLNDITVSLMSGDGSIRQTKSGSNGGGGGEGAGKPPQTASASNNGNPPTDSAGAQDDKEPKRKTKAQEAQWGTQVQQRVIQRFIGRPSVTMEVSGNENNETLANERLYIWGWHGGQRRKAWRYTPYSSNFASWFRWPGLTGVAATDIYASENVGNGKNFFVDDKLSTIPSLRTYGYGAIRCDQTGAPGYDLFSVPETADNQSIVQSGLPLHCFNEDGISYRIDSRLYFDERKASPKLLVVPYCPLLDAVPIAVQQSPEFRKLCIENGSFTFDPSEINGLDTQKLLIDASMELKFFHNVVIPTVVRGENKINVALGSTLNFEINGRNAVAEVYLDGQQNDPDRYRFVITQSLEDGANKISWLPLEKGTDLFNLYRELSTEKRQKFMPAILKKWIKSDQQPNLAGRLNGDLAIVLRVNDLGTLEQQLWLLDTGEASLSEILVDMPYVFPTRSEKARPSKLQKSDLLTSVYRELRVAPRDVGHWRLSLGVSAIQRTNLIALEESCDSPCDPRIRILMDVLPDKGPIIWTGEAISTIADVSVSSVDARRRCYKATQLADTIKSVSDSAVRPLSLRQTMDTISDPDAAFVRFRQFQHFLVKLSQRNQGTCAP